MCSGLLYCVYGLVSLSSWFFLWLLICGLIQGLFWVSFLIFGHLPVTTLGLDLLLGAYVNEFSFCVALHDEIARSKEAARVGVSLPEDRNTAGL
jgi:hypothetical protein